MPFLLNTLPKAGTNLVTAWLKANDLNLRTAISPTRFLGRREVLPRLMPATLRQMLFFDIGLETKALYDLVSFRAKLRRISQYRCDYVSSHIQYSSTTAREIMRIGKPMVYVTRNHFDVLNSYSNYVANTKNHVHYELFHEIGERDFLIAMVQGRRVCGVQFRRFFDELERFDRWRDMSDTLTLDYTEYCKAPVEIGQRFQEQFEARFKLPIQKNLSSAFGKGHTFHKGGNDRWLQNSILVDVISECVDVAAK